MKHFFRILMIVAISFSVVSAFARGKKSEPSDEIVIEDEQDAEHPKTEERKPAQVSTGKVLQIRSNYPSAPELYEVQTDHANCLVSTEHNSTAVSCVPIR